MILNLNQIVAVMRQAGWAEQDVAIAAAVAMAESHGNTLAVNTSNSNGSYDYGLMQINSVHGYSPSLLLSDPVYNAKVGLAIFRQAGFRFTPWAAFNSGSYAAFLEDAVAAAGGTYVPPVLTGTDSYFGREVCAPEAHRNGLLTDTAVVRPGGGSSVPGVDIVIDGVNVVDKVVAPYCVRDSVDFESVLA